MFYDSSDDEDNVTHNPYEDISLATPKQMITSLTYKKLNNIRTEYTSSDDEDERASSTCKKPVNSRTKHEHKTLKRTPKKEETHQHLLHNPAVPGKKKPGAKNKSASKFPAALQDVKKVLDALPSKPEQQSNLPQTIVPSFRGLLWKSTINPMDLFFSTRVQWVDEHNYSSQVYALAEVDISEHTLAKFANNRDLRTRYKEHDLSRIDTVPRNQLAHDNARLVERSNQLKAFFDSADLIEKPFKQWVTYFPNLRKAANLKDTTCSLSEILTYMYVNNYSYFKDIFSSFDKIVAKLDSTQPHVEAFKNNYRRLGFTKDTLTSGIPYLSEGQIPRHALLYSFGVKAYATGEAASTDALYEQNLKPKANKAYLGKMLVSQNPHTLFQAPDKALYIPSFDAEHGGGIIGKCIIGELEIQSRAANLQGVIKKDINTKLPKFHHPKAPNRYKAKYGLDKDLYQAFKSTFEFLLTAQEYGTLSWRYLETILIAHLIQFHEIQLYKYSNQMAEDMEKEIHWVSRANEDIDNPFAP